MRVATAERVLVAEPGSTVDIRVDVVNTGDLIDGITAQVIGLPESSISVEPKLLPLFPDAQGQITLSVSIPSTQPAGLHPLTVEVVSHGSGTPSQHVDVDLSVSARPAVRLSRTPKVIRARRSGRFVLAVENSGNAALDVTLAAQLEDRRTTARFTPSTLTIDPGASAPVILTVRGPRMFTGAEVERSVGLLLTARRVHAIAAMAETETEPELVQETSVILRQRPMISRGLLTALILIGIVALWAAVFLLGMTQVLSGDPMTKTPSTSFFAAEATDADALGGPLGGPGGAGDAGAAPPGALPKTGLVPAGVGGQISGVVTAEANQQPIGRIMVQAYRQGRDGPVLVSSAATQADGGYSLVGLFPTRYTLRFSAKGHDTVWYPQAAGRGGATQIRVAAQGSVEGINTVVAGHPAQITGRIDPGSALVPATTEVVARMLGPTAPEQPSARAVSDAEGRYTLTNLPAPASYELSFTAEGYAPTKVVTQVSGGDHREQPDVVPSAGPGQIRGTVSDGNGPLGGVTVSTTVAGEEVAVSTPTVGAIGSFTLAGLPTPGTYVLTFSSPDHGSSTQIVDLGPGQSRTDLRENLTADSGTVFGTVLGPNGQGLGGATVRVGGTGSDEVPTTTTLTSGDIGAFSISGLPGSGDFTLTVELDGYAPETVPLPLNGSAQRTEVTLSVQLGQIRGRVTTPDGTSYSGATVTVTNGIESWTATSSAPGAALPQGGYLLPSLPPGFYSVTASADGYRQQTALVEVRASLTSLQNLQLQAGG